MTKSVLRKSLSITTALSIGLVTFSSAAAQVWQDVEGQSPYNKKAKSLSLSSQVIPINKARQLKLDQNQLDYQLRLAPSEVYGQSNTLLDIPLPNGDTARYRLYNSPIMAPALAEKHPTIQTFRIVDSENPYNTGRVDVGPNGFHGMLDHDGDTIFIDPIGTSNTYQSYYKADYVNETGPNQKEFECNVKDHNHSKLNSKPVQYRQKTVSFGSELRTYRLAVAATGEFTAFHGGTKEKALAALVTGINRVNQIYEQDLAIKLELVADNDKIIHIDANSDPYTPDEEIDQVSDDINGKIGVDNYDIGHVVSGGGAGGLAGFGVVCSNSKAEGMTGSDSPVNDPFYIDYVAHEIGHQFEANHTFNGAAGSCGGNRAGEAAYEPGSGSTIMGYASLCDDEDLQSNSDAYFHIHSINEMRAFIENPSTGGSCGVVKQLGNSAPKAQAGQDGHIPKETPFVLTGSASDNDGNDKLSYVWEQYDLGAETNGQASYKDDGKRPLFRSFSPTANPTRSFPQISNVLSGTSNFAEALPTTSRDLNFRFTVRDGKGGVTSDDRVLKVDANSGPFKVTAPSTETWNAGSVQTVSWDVANTDRAPINCANVDISFSTDGGKSFGTTLINSAPNNGTAQITVPDSNTSSGRIRVKCANQPFFNVNSGAISVQAGSGGGGGGGGSTNTPPTAIADSYSVNQDSGTTDFAVLDNDNDADNDTLTITSVSDISDGGNVTVSDKSIQYQPATGFSGTETFTYTVSDGKGGAASALVTVTVKANTTTNNSPVAQNDTFSIDQDSDFTRLPVLDNDSDPDNDEITLRTVDVPDQGGEAEIDGNFIDYRPALGFSGTETFSYEIEDGKGGVSKAKVSISIKSSSSGTTSGNTTPAPTSTPLVAPVSGGGGGGGSLGLFSLLLLGLGRLFRRREDSHSSISA